MPNQTIAPYGSWESPITADLIVGGTIGLDEIVLDGDTTYWLEKRPAEAGRCVIVRQGGDGRPQDILPPPYSARTRVHEYGGGAYTVADGVVYFTHFADQRIYRLEPGREPEAITPTDALYYADLTYDRRHDRLLCIREDHRGEGEAVNTVVAISLSEPDEGRVLVEGNDFYASPRPSLDGRRLAWLTWNHPNMPWDGTELWVAEVSPGGDLGRPRLAAGGSNESIFQPEWSPAGDLIFTSDRTGWWNLYRWREGQVESLLEREAEFGQAQWVFGMSTYAFVAPDRLACAYNVKGTWRLGFLDLDTRELRDEDLPFTQIGRVVADDGRLAFIGSSPVRFPAVVELEIATGNWEILQRASALAFDDGYLSRAETIEFPTAGGQTAYGFYYPPKNQDFEAPAGERPPLIVSSHGGPTSSARSSLNLFIQYFTSRGLGYLDVNYGGSTGYGRAYRDRLKGQWGVVDVDDCVNGGLYLASEGRVDEARLAIRGGSAGGYTTLSALTFRSVFRAGSSHYGISDLEAMHRDTHKFESRYLESLIGPYPERLDLYRERSPIYHVDNLSCAMIVFQGLEDKIVPPNQAEMIVDAARRKGLPVAYLPFEGEQHGFRKAETINRAMEAELYFYGRVFGFEPADPLTPVEIENLA